MNITKLYHSAALRNAARIGADVLFLVFLGAVVYFGWAVAAATGM